MIYVADGPSDVPVFSVVESTEAALMRCTARDPVGSSNRRHGCSSKVAWMHSARPITPPDHTPRWLMHAAEAIAHRIVNDREDALNQRMGLPPTHVDD